MVFYMDFLWAFYGFSSVLQELSGLLSRVLLLQYLCIFVLSQFHSSEIPVLYLPLTAICCSLFVVVCQALMGKTGCRTLQSSSVVSVKSCSITSKWATWLSWWTCYCDEALFVAWHPRKLQFRVGSWSILKLALYVVFAFFTISTDHFSSPWHLSLPNPENISKPPRSSCQKSSDISRHLGEKKHQKDPKGQKVNTPWTGICFLLRRVCFLLKLFELGFLIKKFPPYRKSRQKGLRILVGSRATNSPSWTKDTL